MEKIIGLIDAPFTPFLPNGDVLNGNIYETDILGIIERYRP